MAHVLEASVRKSVPATTLTFDREGTTIVAADFLIPRECASGCAFACRLDAMSRASSGGQGAIMPDNPGGAADGVQV